MNTKAIAIIAAFTALTTVLNFIKIPAPYLPTFSYQIGDIALVVAFFLFGPKIGVTTAFLNMVTNIIFAAGPVGFIGPPYYFISVMTMLFGLYISDKIIKGKRLKSKNQVFAKPVTLYTTLGILTRTLIMLPLDYTIYGILVSLVSGLNMSASYALVIATMPSIIFFNITVPLYVVPISYYIAKRVCKAQVPLQL
jgi:riboflavin transporter FmnP